MWQLKKCIAFPTSYFCTVAQPNAKYSSWFKCHIVFCKQLYCQASWVNNLTSSPKLSLLSLCVLFEMLIYCNEMVLSETGLFLICIIKMSDSFAPLKHETLCSCTLQTCYATIVCPTWSSLLHSIGNVVNWFIQPVQVNEQRIKIYWFGP